MERAVRRRDKSSIRLIDDIVVALCADYQRRKLAIAEGSVPKRVRMEYVYINTRMFAAASEVAGFASAERIIDEIGRKVGYANSDIGNLCELSYKSIKQRTKRRIAKALYLE